MVYVADEENYRVDEFSARGEFRLAFGFGVLDGKEELQTCTTVCRAGLHGETASKTLPGEIRPAAVAVDSTGDVYVNDYGNHRVEKFDSEGHFLLMFGRAVNKTVVHVREEEEAKFEPVTVTPAEENLCTQAELTGGDGCGAGAEDGGPGGFLAGSGHLPIAVDAAGDVWVGDNERLEEFNEKGEYVSGSEVSLPGAGFVQSFAVEGEPSLLGGPGSGRFFVRSGNLGPEGALEDNVPGVREYEPSGTEITGAGLPLDDTGSPQAVALDPATGDLFISDLATPEPLVPANTEGKATLLEYVVSSGTEVEAFGSGEVSGEPRGNTLAAGEVGGAPALYVAGSTNFGVGQVFTPLPEPGVPLVVHSSTKAVEVRKTAVTLEAQVIPEVLSEPTTYHFAYVDDAHFKAEGGFASLNTVKTGESASIGEGFLALSASFAVPAGQLTPGTLYHLCAVAKNGNGASTCKESETTFTTLPAAGIDSTYVTEVASDSAVLDAQVNPLGDDTTFHFQYLPQSQFQAEGSFAHAVSVPMPDGDLGSAQSDQLASQTIQGLQAGTVYRYRVITHNEHEHVPYTLEGPAETFTTQGAGGSGLPDGRQWEMVSPPDKLGALIEPINGEPGGVIQAAAAGNAITYHTDAPTEHGVEGNDVQVQVLSRRTAGGWQTSDIAIPHPTPTGSPVNTGQDYRAFSEDLSQALVQPIGEFNPSLSPEGSEQTAYLRSDFAAGDPTEACLPASMHCYRPLVTGAAGYSNVPEGTPFGEEGHCPQVAFRCGPQFVGASPDLSHIILYSAAALTNPPSTSAGGVVGGDFYEWSGGGLQPLDAVLPASEGGARVPFELEQIGNEPEGISNGGTTFFSHAGHLYFYDFGKDMPVRVDVAQGVSEPGVGEAGFLYASRDGSTVLFSDPQRLTTAVGGGIYECRIVQAAGGVSCELELTGLAGGSLVGGSRDASYLYFVAAGGRLQVDHHENGKWTTTQGPAGFSKHTFTISPNGQWLAFMSSEDLTGYDNTDVFSGQPDEEVYLYGAAANKLVCASCEPTGARPVGVEANSGGGAGKHNAPLVDAEGWGNSWLAADVPGPTNYAAVAALYQSRYLSDEGRLFFNSRDGLVPHDENNTWDVYEYQPAGTGPDGARCGPPVASGTIAYRPARSYEAAGGTGEEPAGCVGLISSGSSTDESAFLDASASGSDVFFLTTSKLSLADFDNSYDIYDAHQCTTASPCLPPAAATPPPCNSGDACKGAPPPQPEIFGLSGSATFSGPGNPSSGPQTPPKGKTAEQIRIDKLTKALKACRTKHSKKKRAACVRHARKEFGQSTKKKK
jgi:hypothetical protein